MLIHFVNRFCPQATMGLFCYSDHWLSLTYAFTETTDMAVQNGYIYVTAALQNKLFIIDAVNPTAMSNLDNIDLSGSPTTIEISDDEAYIGWADKNEVTQLDISTPSNVFVGKSIATPDTVSSIAADATYVYVAYGINSDLNILNFSALGNVSLGVDQNGNLVALSEASDNQALSLTNDVLSLENSPSVNLSFYRDNTDNQTLIFNNNILAIEDGNSVNLSTYLDNTDDQTLTFSNNTLTIENGNAVDLSSLESATDILTDADSDTKIQVEESADEDVIRFDINGTEYFRMEVGKLIPLNSNNSVIIGQNTGGTLSSENLGNVLIGRQVGNNITNLDYSIGMGYRALFEQEVGEYNNAVGAFALSNQVSGANYNNAFGGAALEDNTTGDLNTAMGDFALGKNTTASNNTGIGAEALRFTNTGGENTALGY